MSAWLERNKDKDHWALADGFPAKDIRVRALTHRNYQIGIHTHDFVELNLIVAGKGRHYMEGAELAVKTGNAFVVPPKVEHGYVDDGGLDVCHVLLHPGYIADNLYRFRGQDGYLMFFTMAPYFRLHGGMRHCLELNPADFMEIHDLCQKLETEYSRNEFNSGWAAECLASFLIVKLCRAYVAAWGNVTEYDDEHPQLRAVMAAIKLASERHGSKLNLNSLARSAGMERSYFCRVFKRITGMTPMEFAREQTIKEAVKLLHNKRMSIGEIAIALGFSDAAHFSRSFLAVVGHNPSEFRRRKINFT